MVTCCTVDGNEEKGDQLLRKLEQVYENLIKAKDAEINAKNEALKAKDLVIEQLNDKIRTLTLIDNQNKNIIETQNQNITVYQNKDTADSHGKNNSFASKVRNDSESEMQQTRSTASMTAFTRDKPKTMSNTGNKSTRNGPITKEDLQLALHKQQTNTIANKIINLSDETWKDVKRKNRPQRTLGTAKGVNLPFGGVEKRVWLYLYRIQNSATDIKIKKYIKEKEKFKEQNVIVKEIPGEPSKYKRFVVTAPFSAKDDLYEPDFWPENVGVKRFDFTRHREFLKNNADTFL